GRGLRRDAKSVAAGRPGEGREGVRHRTGVDGERGLRRRLRTARQRLVDGLRPAARRRCPAARLRDAQRAVPDQSAGGEGGGGGGGDRILPGGGGRRRRRALAGPPPPPCGPAGGRGARLWGGRRGEAGGEPGEGGGVHTLGPAVGSRNRDR